MATRRILVIEDEADLRETVKQTLEAEGYQVETATSGQEGLRLFGEGKRYDLVLLDQRTPEVEGREVLQVLRGREPNARVIVLSVCGSVELAVRVMRAGAIDLLHKPFTPEVLRGAVAAALAQPREPVRAESQGVSPAGRESALPLVQFRTLNGYKFWPVPQPAGEPEAAVQRVRRGFEVEAPTRRRRRVTVEVTTSIQVLVRKQTGQEHPPSHPIWDLVCKSALGQHLWQEAEMPPENLLVFGVTPEQLQAVRSMAARAHP